MREHDVILTGIPRSGTTLTCHLLNRLPNVVALHEPMRVGELAQAGGPEPACRLVERFFDTARASLLERRSAVSKHVEGRVPDNPIGERPTEGGLRPRRITGRGEIVVDKELRPEFLLVVKHPSAFTALLGRLVTRFRCYAVIRNPLAVLASWNSVQFPVSHGHAPAAERLDAALRQALEQPEDLVERQLRLLSWFFDRYRQVLPATHLVRYEEIVAKGGSNLAGITPAAAELQARLKDQNRNPSYDRTQMETLGRRLLASDGAYWEFYSRQSVEQLLAGA